MYLPARPDNRAPPESDAASLPVFHHDLLHVRAEHDLATLPLHPPHESVHQSLRAPLGVVQHDPLVSSGAGKGGKEGIDRPWLDNSSICGGLTGARDTSSGGFWQGRRKAGTKRVCSGGVPERQNERTRSPQKIKKQKRVRDELPVPQWSPHFHLLSKAAAS